MRTFVIALAATAVLGACGFTPPKPPMPPDGPRVPVNASQPVPPVQETRP